LLPGIQLSERGLHDLVETRTADPDHQRHIVGPLVATDRDVMAAATNGRKLWSGPYALIKGRYSWACITGELDRNKGHWFGLIDRRSADAGVRWFLHNTDANRSG
jgi:hypothetical protein